MSWGSAATGIILGHPGSPARLSVGALDEIAAEAAGDKTREDSTATDAKAVREDSTATGEKAAREGSAETDGEAGRDGSAGAITG